MFTYKNKLLQYFKNRKISTKKIKRIIIIYYKFN